jgi:hypothetical protein
MRAGLARVEACLEGVGEFGEGCREPMARVDIDAEFVVAASQVLDEAVSGADHAGAAEPFEAAHRPQSGLEPSMIGFDRIVGILLGDVARGGCQLIERAGVGRCAVGGHVAGVWAMFEGAGDEPAGGRQIPLLGHLWGSRSRSPALSCSFMPLVRTR